MGMGAKVCTSSICSPAVASKQRSNIYACAHELACTTLDCNVLLNRDSWPPDVCMVCHMPATTQLMDVIFRLMAVPMSLLQSIALSQPDYNCFWLGDGPLQGPTDYTCPPTSVASINDVHGLVHGLIGGISASGQLGGHMAPTETSAYDPMFWMLHSQLDYTNIMHDCRDMCV